MYKLVVFDMDGTIIDSDLMIVLSWRDLYHRFRPGYKPHLSKLIYFSGPSLRSSITKEFPDLPTDEVIAYFRSSVKKYYDETVISYPGTREAVESLKKIGVFVAVDTNKDHAFAEYSLKITGLDHLFDLVVGSDDVTNDKPAPDGLKKAMATFHITDPSQVLYVGDTVYDYETAKNAAVDLMLVTWGVRHFPSSLKPRYYLDDYSHFLEVLKK